MQSLSTRLTGAIRVEPLLVHAEKYLAHIPKAEDDRSKLAETLGQHMDLVLNHALQICKLHHLDPVVERLIEKTVQCLDFFHPEIATDFLLELFVNAIAFHDFGKVNEFFQTDRMRNEDPIFQKPVPAIFDPKHGHSDLGAYIFTVFHLEKLMKSGIPDEHGLDKQKLAALIFFFSNTILLHHSPKLKPPKTKVLSSQFLGKHQQLSKYLALYKGFPTAALFENLAPHVAQFLELFEKKPADFSLFALLRLNFSLLTASDYLATWHYGYGKGVETEKEWGILSGEKREKVINAPRTNLEKAYNIEAYTIFEKVKSGNYKFENPQTASEKNLNILRTEMAVRVLQQLEKESNQRLFYLEAPTGGGKTNLSMLAVAELLRKNPELNKVFYVFPFTTLITQTHKAIRETLQLEEDDIALLHSRAGFQTLKEADTGQHDEEKEDGIYGHRRRDFLQNLFVLYPFTLLTHIRFFDILKSKRKDEIYIMHRLANSIVVLDELQSYPPKQWDKMLYLLEQYSRFFNIRFILMSATLPRLDKIEAVRRASGHFPKFVDLLPQPQQFFQNPNFRGRVKFRFDLLENREADIELSELADVVLEKSRHRAAENEGRVFTIVEFIFKKSATEFQKVMAGLEPFFDEIFVLSGTILESRRREIIGFLKRNRKTPGKKVLLVTTQVVEAGVDIDMDLGFKNVSLIDSDEQLAGRVNRNVSKENCEVYLFLANDPGVLHRSDLRYKITRDMARKDPRFHQKILENKNFGAFYERVFAEIEKTNRSEMVENFETDYFKLIQKLDFPEVDAKFKIIENQTLSVFVPVFLPLEIENEKGEKEAFFNKFELEFLKKSKVWNPGEPEVNGEGVWKIYRETIENPQSDFIAKKIAHKVLQGILSKFTFSLFDGRNTRTELLSYCDEKQSFESYFYMDRHADLYEIETGLDESKLKNPDNFF